MICHCEVQYVHVITFTYSTYCLISVIDKPLRFVKSDELCHTNNAIRISIQETEKKIGQEWQG